MRAIPNAKRNDKRFYIKKGNSQPGPRIAYILGLQQKSFPTDVTWHTGEVMRPIYLLRISMRLYHE
jgi:hypothetical protein